MFDTLTVEVGKDVGNTSPGFTGGGSCRCRRCCAGASAPGVTDSAGRTGETTWLGSGASAGGFSACCWSAFSVELAIASWAPLASLGFATCTAAFTAPALAAGFVTRGFWACFCSPAWAFFPRFAGGWSSCCCFCAGLFSVELGKHAIADAADGEGVLMAGEESAGEAGGVASLAPRQFKIAARPVRGGFCGVSHAADPSPLAVLKRCTLDLAILKKQGSNVRRRAHTVLNKKEATCNR